MAVEHSVASPIASPSAKRLKSTGDRAAGSSASESGNGVNCHQCRQKKTRNLAAACKNTRKNKRCVVKMCSKCLFNRYGEKVEEVGEMEKWLCPKCRGICNCSVCMKQRGHLPTGILSTTAKETGFSSASEMLKSDGRVNHETSSTAHKEIMLPLGTDLTSVAGIEMPAEDVGNALEFLEFCSVFGEILKMRRGEGEYILQEIMHARLTKRGKLCPIVQFHMHLLSIIKTEQGEKFAKPTGSNGKNSWFDELKICLAESQRVLKPSGVASLEEATDYEALNASDKIAIKSIWGGTVEIVPMKQMDMDWVPYILLENGESQVEGLKNSQIFILSRNQSRPGPRPLKKFECCLPYLYNPLHEDKLEQSAVVDLLFPIDPKPVFCKFDWELDELEEFTDKLIEDDELPADQKEPFQNYVKEKICEAKKAKREARDSRKKAHDELNQQEKAAFENMKIYKFYGLPTPDTPDVSDIKSPFINRYYGNANKVI